MLIEVDPITFAGYFPSNPHPFLSEPFIELNKAKADRILRLVENIKKPSVGLIVGVKHGILLSPFSAPFGGFHFRKENIYISELENFISSLQSFVIYNCFSGIQITLPPDIYHPTFNAKAISSLIRKGFESKVPEITSYVNLDQFQNSFSQKNSSKYYRQAVRNGLSFNLASDPFEKEKIFELIIQNRTKYDRPIYMTLDDIFKTGKLWEVDFFNVFNIDKELAASAIFYRSHPEICYGVFWGDSDRGRPLRAIDYLAFNLWSYYKDLGFKYLDLGISTESGKPNEGLLRFKETHEATSNLRYTFYWKKDFS